MAPAWRRANAGHVSLEQLKVMSAIENCRTAALGGHVARCEDCAYTTIAYNSCRNRHCPKCQGAAAKEWLAAREADLLPVPYYHVVFTLPAPIGDIAYQNKAVIYDLLFKASAETLTTIAADPKHLGARVGITSVLHSWGSALTHHPHVHMIVPGGGISPDGKSWVSCRPGFFLPGWMLARIFCWLFLEKLAAAHQAGRLKFFGDHAGLDDRQAFATISRRCAGPNGTSMPSALRRTGAVGLSVSLHPPCPIANSRLSLATAPASPSDGRTIAPRGRPPEVHDTLDRRVHPPLPDPHSAAWLPPHPSLGLLTQWHARRQHRPSASVTHRCKT